MSWFSEDASQRNNHHEILDKVWKITQIDMFSRCKNHHFCILDYFRVSSHQKDRKLINKKLI